ncbi:hypothetical protein BKA70DRAFT_56046 [Coprinopsis sp. MPI-PUGE-AT-0042]|nr:hypothetical protein BKA70DRAFT_56046 [Coprinopsis sp. MPI-PUGE-AT-0042]
MYSLKRCLAEAECTIALCPNRYQLGFCRAITILCPDDQPHILGSIELSSIWHDITDRCRVDHESCAYLGSRRYGGLLEVDTYPHLPPQFFIVWNDQPRLVDMSPAQPSTSPTSFFLPLPTALSAFGQVDKLPEGGFASNPSPAPKLSKPHIASIVVPIVLVVVLGLAGAIITKRRRSARGGKEKALQAKEGV